MDWEAGDKTEGQTLWRKLRVFCDGADGHWKQVEGFMKTSLTNICNFIELVLYHGVSHLARLLRPAFHPPSCQFMSLHNHGLT